MKTSNIYIYMAVVLIIAIITVLMIGHQGFGVVKLAGLLLATLAVIPVFAILIKTKSAGRSNLFLGVFVAGFFYKLIILIAGIWWVISKIGWDSIDFTVSCLAFMFAFQICESLYFWGKKEN